jgi:hypothetical protein
VFTELNLFAVPSEKARSNKESKDQFDTYWNDGSSLENIHEGIEQQKKTETEG